MSPSETVLEALIGPVGETYMDPREHRGFSQTAFPSASGWDNRRGEAEILSPHTPDPYLATHCQELRKSRI